MALDRRDDSLGTRRRGHFALCVLIWAIPCSIVFADIMPAGSNLNTAFFAILDKRN